jgi:hypothetical protein
MHQNTYNKIGKSICCNQQEKKCLNAEVKELLEEGQYDRDDNHQKHADKKGHNHSEHLP